MGVGCGPCENLLSYFAQNETADRPLRLLVFNQGDSDERIRKKLLPYKVDCPVFVPDASEKHVWGDVYGRYAVEGLPTTVLIEPGGAIIKHRTGVLGEE